MKPLRRPGEILRQGYKCRICKQYSLIPGTLDQYRHFASYPQDRDTPEVFKCSFCSTIYKAVDIVKKVKK